MIRAVHIEDEPRNIALLQSLITTHCSHSVTLVGNATNLQDAYELVKNEKPQLVYLDIELNQGSAFELLERLQQTIGIHFEIIFITAFSEYAIKAFKQNAVDYILKPISTDELKQATARAVEKITYTNAGQNIMAVLNQFRQEAGIFKVGLPVTAGLHFVNTDDIMRVEAKGGCAVIYLTEGKTITCTKTLKDIEELLPAPQFIRVHNAWVVNNKHLKKYYRGKSSYIEMEDGAAVPVSIRKKGDFLDMI
jgi:two-component system, LytTR family, response regulator